jgi:hypothetical protein
MTQPQNLFIPADAGEKVTLPGIEITIEPFHPGRRR